MTTKILTIFTRTPLHVGAGSSVGAIDQPIVRERHTRFPVIPGSAIKGVMADLWTEREQAMKDGKPVVDKENKPVMIRTGDGKVLFGSDDPNSPHAGKLLVGEGKLLAFPVRSAVGCFAWLTCPLAISRFKRDFGANQVQVDALAFNNSAQVYLTAGTQLKFEQMMKVVFEEYPLSVAGQIPSPLLEIMQPICDDPVWQNVVSKLAVVSDKMFAYFVENACEVAHHIRIDDATGVVADGALFNQENVPSEALFYAMLKSEKDNAFELLGNKLGENQNLLQIGADITTGLGWSSVKMMEVAQ